MRVVTFKIDEETLHKFETICYTRLRITRSECIRRAMIEFMNKYSNDKKKLVVKRITLW